MYSDEEQINSEQLEGLEWSVLHSLKQGETECGDTYLVKEHENKILIAVIDGLGHGARAAKASRRAAMLLEGYNNQSLINLVKDCHNGLRGTRGAVMGLALINSLEHTLAWIGIGNVDGVLLLGNGGNQTHIKRIVQRGGIVGYNLPFLQASMFAISSGDTLILATDGVRNDYAQKINISNSPEEIVKISSRFIKNSDDALILAAKYKGKARYGYAG